MTPKTIRLLKTGHRNGAWNMGVDEALMKTCSEPVLRLYGWNPPTVSIGYFQGLEEDVDLAACRRHGVDVVRRITGGGAVFHDAELTYSFVTRDFKENIIDSYEDVCAGILLGLKGIGVNGQFVPLNDLVLENGKKFSGNAQTRKGGVLLQHGTILLDVDVDKMFSILKVPSEKMRDKIVQNVKERVTGIRKTFDETALALEKGFTEHVGAALEPMDLSDEQAKMADSFAERYRSDEWLRMR
ncbi:MAG: biotin/lipoate A/B protein ligase family protein [Candidatus Micrarchaeota archaeon]|nr:biotin/lipoate A/B protein ligase family protein [Candidatus Micrarchaeota archaeon]